MNENQRSISRKYITYKFLTNLWFIGAIWLYFYRIFITDQQVGVLDSIAFTIGLIAEVPSGALADKFGRDKLTKLGQILAGSGLLIQALSSSFTFFVTGQAIMMIGVSFVSGADEALFYESLKFDETSKDWRKLVTKGSQVALIGTLIATIIGGWLHDINPRIPWILNGIALVISAIIIWSIKDNRVMKARQKLIPEIKDYLKEIKTGFMQFRSPKLSLYVPLILTVQGLFYTAGYGLLRLVLLDRFHFSPFFGSITIASCSLITVGLLAYINKYSEKISEKRMLTVIGLIAAASLLLSVADMGLWGYIVILALYAGEHILHPFMSEVLNTRTSEDQRATVLSVASFFRTLPYIALAPIIGYLNTENKLEYFLIIWSILILLAVILYLIVRRRDRKIDIEIEESEIEYGRKGIELQNLQSN